MYGSQAQTLEVKILSQCLAALAASPRFFYGSGGAADLTRRESQSALQRRTRACALPRSPAADTRSHRRG